jgi:hypothetical protein
MKIKTKFNKTATFATEKADQTSPKIKKEAFK